VTFWALSRSFGWRTVVVTAAALAAAVSIPARSVDRVYSLTLYPRLQPLLTSASNATPVAVLDVLLVAAIVGFTALAWRDARADGAPRAIVRVAVRAVVIAATAYLAFLGAWGCNYRRVPLAEALRFESGRVTAAAAHDAAMLAVERVNALHDVAHAEGWPARDAIDGTLVAGLYRALADLGRGVAIVPARPKWTLLDWYFRRAGVDGMTDPFALETLVSSDVLPFERPFVVAHEWSHLAGFADEGDANFVGWLACMRSTNRAQYSGWLFLYSQMAQSIGSRAAAPIAERLAPGPRADLRAIRDRIVRQVSPRVAAAGWRAYDAYLKANRVEAGTASYAQVVRLALGIRLPSGEPALEAGR
jgi:uncharacterized protein DUF3810